VIFDFAIVNAEMEYINGKRQTGGKISLNKFFEGLIFKCENG
jgi:two-component system response regulator YcbB